MIPAAALTESYEIAVWPMGWFGKKTKKKNG